MITRRSKKRAARPRSRSSGARARVASICLALPDTDCSDKGDHSIYRVRGKVFAYFLDDHHGDGIVSVCVKTEFGENADRARLDAERCYLPAYIGPRGWLGFRLDRKPVDWGEVRELVERSFRLAAPKTSLARLPIA
jgi:predicted DNA-binding protein (MmcQ/YjbR family)